MHNKKIKVGLIQMSCTHDTKANLAKTISRIREAACKGGTGDLPPGALCFNLFLLGGEL